MRRWQTARTRSRAIRRRASRSSFSAFTHGCICSWQRGRGRERRRRTRTIGEAEEGELRPTIAGIVCIKAIDQAGAALLQHARGFLTGFQACLLRSPIVLVLRRRSRPRPLARGVHREKTVNAGRQPGAQPCRSGDAFVRVYGRATPDGAGARPARNVALIRTDKKRPKVFGVVMTF
jgi:hypothetical protein